MSMTPTPVDAGASRLSDIRLSVKGRAYGSHPQVGARIQQSPPRRLQPPNFVPAQRAREGESQKARMIALSGPSREGWPISFRRWYDEGSGGRRPQGRALAPYARSPGSSRHRGP